MKFGLSESIYTQIKDIVNKYSKYTFKIFGSRARGDYKSASDIDLAVYQNVDDKDKYKILNDFDLLDIPYFIDIVFVEDNIRKELFESIQKEGKEF